MALMGSRGYQLVAKVLAEAYKARAMHNHGTVERITKELADLFQSEHPVGFDRQRFYQNVGLIPMKESNHAVRER